MIRVQLFAGLAEEVGARRVELSVPEGTTVQQLKRELARQYPRLTDKLETCMVAVNEEYVDPDENVTSSDTVVLIPPVSGG
ncbi:MAG: molybdopterin converting factor subunit 1 [Novibacillus thermophilus]|jgi:molybdopterin converting factor subunit 1